MPFDNPKSNILSIVAIEINRAKKENFASPIFNRIKGDINKKTSPLIMLLIDDQRILKYFCSWLLNYDLIPLLQ